MSIANQWGSSVVRQTVAPLFWSTATSVPELAMPAITSPPVTTGVSRIRGVNVSFTPVAAPASWLAAASSAAGADSASCAAVAAAPSPSEAPVSAVMASGTSLSVTEPPVAPSLAAPASRAAAASAPASAAGPRMSATDLDHTT